MVSSTSISKDPQRAAPVSSCFHHSSSQCCRMECLNPINALETASAKISSDLFLSSFWNQFPKESSKTQEVAQPSRYGCLECDVSHCQCCHVLEVKSWLQWQSWRNCEICSVSSQQQLKSHFPTTWLRSSRSVLVILERMWLCCKMGEQQQGSTYSRQIKVGGHVLTLNGI